MGEAVAANANAGKSAAAGGVMLEIVVLAILVVGVACVATLDAMEKEAASRTWPVMRSGAVAGEPAEEGAPVPGAEAASGEAETLKAA